MPHTGRAQIGPVTSTTVQKTTPTSALTSATMSAAGLALDQVIDRGSEVDEEEDERGPGRRHVVVEDALHVAHGLFGGRADQSPYKARSSAGSRSGPEDGEGCFMRLAIDFIAAKLQASNEPAYSNSRLNARHSAFNTVSNNSKHTVVNTRS